MQKLNWFSRLFMSWRTLEEHFKQNDKSKIEIAVLNEKIKGQEKQIKTLNEYKLEKEQHLLVEKEKLSKVKSQLQEIENELRIERYTNASQSSRINSKDAEIKSLQYDINDKKNYLNELKTKIVNKLEPLKKIDRTFFGISGNKGKGELGELQLKILLEKSGIDKSIWQENLFIENKTVELAMRSGNHDKKWIPIDSKVLDAQFDDAGKLIDYQDFAKRVKQEAKKVSEYLGKKNTTEYGLLVLQNDNIYLSLYAQNPSCFKEIIEEYKIYITSPSLFIQMAWSISHIIKIFESINNDQKIYDDMTRALSGINKFCKSIEKTHKNFGIAMDSHYPSLQKQHDQLLVKLSKAGKIKKISKLLQ